MTVETLFYLFINLFSLFLIKEYLKIFFINSPKSILTTITWAIAVFWQLIATFFVTDNWIINLSISILMILFIAEFAYQGSLHKKIIFVILFNVIWMLAEVLSAFLFDYITFHSADRGFLASFVSKLFMLIIIKIIDFGGSRKSFGEIPLLTGMIMLTIPSGSIYITCYIFYCNYKFYNDISLFYQILAYLVILFINFIIYILYDKIVMESELRRNNSIYEKQLESCKQNALMQREMEKELRVIRHDIKYQILYIQSALKEGKYEETQQFLENLNYLSKIKVDKFLNTSNLIVDSLINYEYSLAKAAGIKFISNIEIGDFTMEDGDFCLLLGNILDNAREASVKVNSSDRFIRVYMKELKNTLNLVVQNPFINCLKRDQLGKIISSKENKFQHGVGLSTIEKIVTKYKGTYIIDTKNNIFTLKVMLYL